MKGLFINFEGLDGSGKSSIISNLESILLSKGYKVIKFPEFSDSIFGDELKNRLKSDKFLRDTKDFPTSITQSLLVMTDLAYIFEYHIRDYLENNHIVLKDRYIDTIISSQLPFLLRDYPNIGSERLYNFLDSISSIIPKPDITFYVYTDDKIRKERIRNRYRDEFEKNSNKISKEDEEIFKMREEVYNKIINNNKNIYIINNNGTLDKAVSQVLEKVEGIYERKT
ncbi:MAG: dTMP kinase [Candidatus Parvarchaeum sp.]